MKNFSSPLKQKTKQKLCLYNHRKITKLQLSLFPLQIINNCRVMGKNTALEPGD